jgi:hypothetical protein
MRFDPKPFVLVAALVCAAGARAQGQAPAADKAKTAPQTQEQKKAVWADGVKTGCAVEIAPGGVCAGMDFDSGLEKCLHQNRKKLTAGCRAAIYPRHKKSKDQKNGAKTGESQAPAATPAAKTP